MKIRHGIICAAYLILLKENKVLLLRRFNTGYEDGNYSLPAGHVEEGESVSDTMVREVKEEIGIFIKKEDIVLSHTMHRLKTAKSDERLDFFFICKKWDGEVRNLEPQKCDDLSWFDVGYLPENVITYVSLAVNDSLQGVAYSEIK